ncbi:hypothetical protein VTH06DRAFT_4735 [Thermothelomyces fergusii]
MKHTTLLLPLLTVTTAASARDADSGTADIVAGDRRATEPGPAAGVARRHQHRGRQRGDTETVAVCARGRGTVVAGK